MLNQKPDMAKQHTFFIPNFKKDQKYTSADGQPYLAEVVPERATRKTSKEASVIALTAQKKKAEERKKQGLPAKPKRAQPADPRLKKKMRQAQPDIEYKAPEEGVDEWYLFFFKMFACSMSSDVFAE